MIKYVLDAQVNRLIGSTEENQINLYSAEYGNIDSVYIVKEEGELDYYGQKFDLSPGDIVLRLYSRDTDYNKREIVVIPAQYAKVWVENMKMKKESEEKSSDICATCEEVK